MSEGKIRIGKGTPEEIAAYKQAFQMVHSPDWKKNSIPMDAAADNYRIEAAKLALSTGDLFNELVRRLNYDGSDTASLTLGEIARAVDGAIL
jgi:hypothetical protein